MRTHVLFEGAPGEIVRDGDGDGDGDVVVEGVGGDDLVAAAVRAGAGAEVIELCGGVAVDVAARVRAAVDVGVDVRVNRYGFESLEQAAAYKQAFAAGEDPGGELFLYGAARSTPLEQHGTVLVAGVSDLEDLAARVREALPRGVGIVELYAGLGVAAAAAAREASGHTLPVGYVG